MHSLIFCIREKQNNFTRDQLVGTTSDEDGAYDPYLVFKQKRDSTGIQFEIDKELSKKYSLSQRYEWHGEKYNEKIIVNQKTGKKL